MGIGIVPPPPQAVKKSTGNEPTSHRHCRQLPLTTTQSLLTEDPLSYQYTISTNRTLSMYNTISLFTTELLL